MRRGGAGCLAAAPARIRARIRVTAGGIARCVAALAHVVAYQEIIEMLGRFDLAGRECRQVPSGGFGHQVALLAGERPVSWPRLMLGGEAIKHPG
jgi:hypothetical protein